MFAGSWNTSLHAAHRLRCVDQPGLGTTTVNASLHGRIAILGYVLLCAGGACAQSVIPNPDFDLGTAGWNGGTLVGSDGSPSAPSFLVVSPPYNQVEAYSDCFPIDATLRYTFAARMRIISGSVGIVLLGTYSDGACAVSVDGSTAHVASSFSNGDWVALSSSDHSFLLPPGAIGGRISFVTNSGISEPGQVLFDHINLQPDDVFAGNFE